MKDSNWQAIEDGQAVLRALGMKEAMMDVQFPSQLELCSQEH